MSKLYKEYSQLNLSQLAKDVLTDWQVENLFEQSLKNRAHAPAYIFYEGPPSANGMPGIHHVMARAIKDIFCRFQTQKGKLVQRKAGWDTHGLPVELGVEKALGITKEDIGISISIEAYNQKCRESVMQYTAQWNDLTQKMGYWVDLESPYITYEPKYMESVWWLIKQIYNKGLLYKGYTIQPYSPAAGTGLSSHELNMPGTYQEVTDTTIVAQFKAQKDSHPFLKDLAGDVFFLAWTTTPWTLPSNTALTVGPKIEYSLVQTYNQYTHKPMGVILATPLINKQFSGKFTQVDTQQALESYTADAKSIPFFVLKTIMGKDLVGAKYDQLLPWANPAESPEKAFVIIDGDFVTTEDGTGIVHTAPTFGADDAKVAKAHGIPAMLVKDQNDQWIPLVDLQGKFIAQLPHGYGGRYVKNEYYAADTAPERSVDVDIAILLKEQNGAFKVEKYKHPYPHCWRTDKPVLYYPLDSWFIKITDVKQRMGALNQTINWKPKSTGEGRFGNWLDNANDWNLSRSRYWGIPLPIWRTEDGTEEILIGSVEELIKEIEKSINAGMMTENPFGGFEVGNMSEENYGKIDLHKNIVDKIILLSSKGHPMKRESDLIDVWFDSGAMPYAQWHYPFENKDLIDQGKAFPADFIAEGVDQTRGWFYTLHAIATLVFDQVAYKNVVSNGLVLDKNGQKMSKRLGNAIDPFTTLETYGADATRWYMMANAQPWDNLKFDLEGVDEVRRKFFGTLYNTYSFFALYANVDNFQYQQSDIPLIERSELDQWILSELHSLIQLVDDSFSDYEPTKAARAIQYFVTEHLSNWYVRLNRRRFWKGDMSRDKLAAYQTLYECLITVAKLTAPIAPFFADRLYRDLNAVTQKEAAFSVHLTDFPKANTAYINTELQTQTELAQTVTSLVFSLRKKEKIKVRQPLPKAIIPVSDPNTKRRLHNVTELIKAEVNIKALELLDPNTVSDLLVKTIKPNFKLLGPKYGGQMKLVANAIMGLDNTAIAQLETTGGANILVEGQPITISLDDVEIATADIPGWTVASDQGVTVALDLTLNDELLAEGVSREMVNRLQNLRKDNGLELTDRIEVQLQASPAIKTAVLANQTYVCEEVLADKLEFVESLTQGTDVEIEGETLRVGMVKV